jgi:hypothetical protein
MDVLHLPQLPTIYGVNYQSFTNCFGEVHDEDQKAAGKKDESDAKFDVTGDRPKAAVDLGSA